jgi:lysophospholipase L1-like esterase
MASGADVAGNDYAHNGLGGVELTAQQSAAILNEQNTENLQDFQKQPLFARIFDTSSDYSLISRVAVSMPSNVGIGTFQNVFSSFLSNPFSIISNSLATIISPVKVDAAGINTAGADPFAITQYGYPDSAIPGVSTTLPDPDKFWKQNCSDYQPNAPGQFTNNYNNVANNGTNLDDADMPLNPQDPTLPADGTDPCLLIDAAVGSAGGVFDSSLLNPDDLQDSNAATTTTSNKNIYLIGDSLTCGMDSAGLETQLTSSGWTVGKVECTVGINTAASIAKLQADSAQVKAAGTVAVELGTNNCALSTGTPSCDAAGFQTAQTQMIDAIKAINPTAQITWMNIYTTKGPVYQGIDSVIQNQAGPLGYKMIDWASQAQSGGYTFDAALGVHPTDYTKMAAWYAGQIGPAVGLNNIPKNYVATVLNSENPPAHASMLASIWHKINIFSRDLVQPLKGLDNLWSKPW